jgi:hypothetical protein
MKLKAAMMLQTTVSLWGFVLSISYPRLNAQQLLELQDAQPTD